MVGRQDQPPKQRAIRTVQPLNVCDGGAVLKDIGTKGRSVELHPLAVLFNPANDLNQPQLLFLRVDDARGELLFSRQPGVSRSKCLAAYPLKSLVFVQGLSKHTFALGRHGGPPINLEAHDAFACKQYRFASQNLRMVHSLAVPPPPAIATILFELSRIYSLASAVLIAISPSTRSLVVGASPAV